MMCPWPLEERWYWCDVAEGLAQGGFVSSHSDMAMTETVQCVTSPDGRKIVSYWVFCQDQNGTLMWVPAWWLQENGDGTWSVEAESEFHAAEAIAYGVHLLGQPIEKE